MKRIRPAEKYIFITDRLMLSIYFNPSLWSIGLYLDLLLRELELSLGPCGIGISLWDQLDGDWKPL